ncbi:protein NUD1 [Kluyveromyces marxianus]|nr:protein NUD1 [Kluyveromyces marxianus]
MNMDLAESLQNFHITSPQKKNQLMSNGVSIDFNNSDDFVVDETQDDVDDASNQNSESKKYDFKQYRENEIPLPQQFGSFFSKMDEWSVNYGTVKALKNNENKNEGPNDSSKINRKDETSQAQWKNYLLKPRTTKHQSPKDASDLIVTASLSDLSLIPPDTFKKKEKNEYSSVSQETDPAKEAKSVFNNVLRHQRSNYFKDNSDSVAQNTAHFNDTRSNFQEIDRRDSDSDSSSNSVTDSNKFDTTSDLESDTASVLNTSAINSPSPKPRIVTNTRQLPLITPEDAGLVFDHETGLWDKQRIAVVTDSSAADNTTSSFTIEENQSDHKSTKNTNNNDRSLKHLNENILSTQNKGSQIGSSNNNTIPGENKTEKQVDENHDNNDNNDVSTSVVTDDTPLSTPRFNRQLYQKNNIKATTTRQPSSSLHRELSNSNLNADSSNVDITNISRMDTSYDLTKREIVSRLLEIEPNPIKWKNLFEVDLSNQTIKDSCIGIDELLPALVNLNIANNELISLQGIPKQIQSLNISNNRLRSQLLQFQDLPHLEELDISNNNLSSLQDLRLVSSLSHLRYLDVSNCGIVSLIGLPAVAKLDTLIARDNRLIGSIDFKQLCEVSPIPWRSLTKLDLSNNKITNLKNLHYLTKLRVLILDGNSIERLHSDIHADETNDKYRTGNPSLRYLSIRNGRVSVNSFSGFPNLRILRVSVPADYGNDDANSNENAHGIGSEQRRHNVKNDQIPESSLSKRYPLPFPLESLEIIGMPPSSPKSQTISLSQPQASQKRIFGVSTNVDPNAVRPNNKDSDVLIDSSPWESVIFPSQLREVTLRCLNLTRVPQTLTNNTALYSLDVSGNKIYSAQMLLPSLPQNLLRLNILQNPVLELVAIPTYTSSSTKTNLDTAGKSETENNLAVQDSGSRHRDLQRLLLHWCPALVESDLNVEG